MPALAAAACGETPGTLYLTSGAGDVIVVLDAADGTHRADLAVDPRPSELDEPHGVALSPDGAFLYATVAHGAPSLWKFERPGDRRIGRLALGGAGAARIAVSPDGRTGYVADYERGSGGAPGEVVAVDLEDLSLLARARVCAGPHDVQPDPSGAVLAVACSLGDEIVFLDARTLRERSRVAAGTDVGPPGQPRYRPMNVAWLDGGAVAVTLMGSGELILVDTAGAVRRRAAVGAGPAQVAWEPSTRTFVVANRGDGTASLVDVEPWGERLRVPLDATHPHGVAVDPDGARAFVSYEGDVDGPGGVVALDARSGRILWRAAAGVYTLGVAFAPG